MFNTVCMEFADIPFPMIPHVPHVMEKAEKPAKEKGKLVSA